MHATTSQTADSISSSGTETISPQRRRLHYYFLSLALAVVGLVFLGGLVTSTDSGLSVPDWPLSFGSLNPPGWWNMDHVKFEHGHRLYAATVGLFTVVGVFWLQRIEPRGWVKRLSLFSILSVVLQGVLGGVTVLLKLPVSVSMGHAVLGQTFFLILVTLAVVTSPAWLSAETAFDSGARATQRLAIAAAGVIYVQLMLGAWMRHAHAGLAITDWPTSLGRIVPPLDDALVALHFAHRTFAYVVVLFVSALAGRLLTRHRQATFALFGTLLFGLIGAQFALGVTIIWTLKSPLPTTLHVTIGALTLATTWIATLWSFRLLRVTKASSTTPLSVATTAHAA